MKVEKGLLYTKDHEWVKVEGEFAYIGIADYAQSSLGDIVYVELPEIDDELSAEDSLASVESVKAAAEVFIPVDGTVVEINEDLEDDPALLNKEPYAYWIAKVELSDKSQLDELMSDEDYTEFLKEA